MEAAFTEAASLGKVANLGFFLKSYRSMQGTISPPELEQTLEKAALTGDARHDSTAMSQVQKHLLANGFTSAPGSAELVKLFNDVCADELRRVGTDIRNCMGWSPQQLSEVERLSFLSPPVARLVCASMAQLQLVLPADALVLGPLEGTFRGERGGISWLHTDEHRTGVFHLRNTLFPSTRPEIDQEAGGAETAPDIFEHYNDLREELHRRFPELVLPEPFKLPGGTDAKNGGQGSDDGHEDGDCSLELDEKLQNLSTEVISALKEYNRLNVEELVLDFVNVWIPKAQKQLALLPFEHSRGAVFERDTRLSVEEAEAAGFIDKFRSFGPGTAVMFFGRHVLHQVADGPEFTKCTEGSMESRYLVLMPRKSAHRYSLARHSCISQLVVGDPSDERNAEGEP
eukprot:TRINITY_DN27502_c1_g1_i1.p1 TRINITY_DN27502_c1_g1~~TRINITY_DN27502_c1_g1_i1.p1  ORF type:complete len:400 (-),score=87.63 TRINITY_DN27502_c1_g1_i1:127-1326(-)